MAVNLKSYIYTGSKTEVPAAQARIIFVDGNKVTIKFDLLCVVTPTKGLSHFFGQLSKFKVAIFYTTDTENITSPAVLFSKAQNSESKVKLSTVIPISSFINPADSPMHMDVIKNIMNNSKRRRGGHNKLNIVGTKKQLYKTPYEITINMPGEVLQRDKNLSIFII